MSGTLALASAIAEMDRGALTALARARRPMSPSSVSDPIGFAADLLKPDSIARAIAPLDRGLLSALRLGSDPTHLPQLVSLGLLGTEAGAIVRLPEVDAVLNEALAAHGVAPERLSEPTTASPPEQAHDTSAWFTSALTAVGQSAEALRTLRDRPGRLNRTGSIAVATVKQIADSTGVDASDVALTLSALLRTELIASLADDQLLITAARSSEWLALDHVQRWLRLATAAAAAMPHPLRVEWERVGTPGQHLGLLAASIPHRYPLLPGADLEAVAEYVRSAEHLGLTFGGALTSVADGLLGGADVTSAVQHAMPDPAVGVYVQPDLSVVVPGPLDPADEAVLAALARPEHIGVASTRRVSETSIAEAYERGLTPESAREAFSRISLTGIPQPLDYLIESLGARVGGIVVGEYVGDEGRTRISLARAEVASTLLVDRSLQHLQLHRSTGSDTELFSRLSADHVLAALADARYHATSHDAALRTGAPTLARVGDPQRASSPQPADTEPPLAAPLLDLVDRVYSAARSEPGTGDFTRRLELAIRDRSAVLVTAEARGQVRTFTLLPVSVNAGRLRAADQAAGVERTFPVSMITSVEPV